MVAYTDKLIGRLVGRLEELGIRDDTLILLTADNGHTPADHQRAAGRDRRAGRQGTDDRLRHPRAVHRLLAGGVRGRPDVGRPGRPDGLLPSTVEAAGAALPDDRVFDGRSFLPVLRGEVDSARDWVFTDFRPRFLNFPEVTFVHDRRYKLYDDGRFFDYENDVEEENPLDADDLTEEAAAARARPARRDG